jgi:Raf kinase inhibitor-like YbhB/YbcL family protein
MSDEPTPPPDVDDNAGPRWALIVISVLVVVGAAIAAFALFGSDDDDSSTATTQPAETTAVTETTTAATAPETTEAPEATTAPETTEAPATTETPSGLEFTIDDIDDGETIPVEFTCDGDDTPPLVSIESSPEGTLQLAFVVDDPDAPGDDPFVHWVVYDIPGNTTEFTDAEEELTYGVNDAQVEGWTGPCPPPGDGPHEYVFTLFALDEELELEPGLDGRDLADAIADATIAETEITATYERAG